MDAQYGFLSTNGLTIITCFSWPLLICDNFTFLYFKKKLPKLHAHLRVRKAKMLWAMIYKIMQVLNYCADNLFFQYMLCIPHIWGWKS